MNHITSNASSVIAIWRRFTQSLTSNSKDQDSTQRIISPTRPTQGLKNIGSDLRFYRKSITSNLTPLVLSRLEPIRGSERAASRIARSVAIAIGISLSIVPSPISQGVNAPIQTIEVLADKQLTEKQEHCHDLIAFKESSNNRLAVNGSHYGYYQGRSKALLNAPDDYQFYWYWSYVSNRYGITEYDEPNYCKALHHLRVKGWQ